MKKRLFSILLTVVTCVSMCIPSIASEAIDNRTSRNTTIQDVANRIKNDLPGAEVRIANGAIHVVLNDISDLNSIITRESTGHLRSTSVYSINGGTFRNFSVPSNAMLIPVAQVYMSKSVVTARLLQLSRPSIVDTIVSLHVADQTAPAIATYILNNFGVSVEISTIETVISLIPWLVTSLDYWSLEAAQNSSPSGKVSAMKAFTSDGYYTFYYTPWTSNYCTTYAGYDAVWYSGEYDF